MPVHVHVRAIEPGFVFDGGVDGAFEGAGPEGVGGVVVGMGDDDCSQAAEGVYLDWVVVRVRDTEMEDAEDFCDP